MTIKRHIASSLPIDGKQLHALIDAARTACAQAYAPYSRFRVGAACLAASGRVYAGSNVENASYGLSICAERAAIFTAVNAGERDIVAVALYTPTPQPVSPCGACRQVICEFGDAIEVIAASDGDSVTRWTSGELLPARFKL